MKQGLVVFGSHFQIFTADVAQMLILSGYFTYRIVTFFDVSKGRLGLKWVLKKETVRFSETAAAYNPTRRRRLEHNLKISGYRDGRPETIIAVVLC